MLQYKNLYLSFKIVTKCKRFHVWYETQTILYEFCEINFQ